MKKILITGANGLLGRSLCSILSNSEHEIFGIVHKKTDGELVAVKYLQLDFAGEWRNHQLPSNIDTIIHLAQSSKFRDFPKSALDVFSVNIESTARLLDYANSVGAKQFIYASSGGIYGHGAQAFQENASIVPPGKLGYYLGSKACGEILVQSYASNFQVIVLRPFFIYGPEQNRSMLIPRLVDSIAKGKPINLQGEKGIQINPIHVEDAAKAIKAALNYSESATFNIAGPEILSIRGISEGIADYIGKRPIFQQMSGQPRDLIADISAMKKNLHAPKLKLLQNLNDVKV